jgi:hypothetical protein
VTEQILPVPDASPIRLDIVQLGADILGILFSSQASPSSHVYLSQYFELLKVSRISFPPFCLRRGGTSIFSSSASRRPTTGLSPACASLLVRQFRTRVIHISPVSYDTAPALIPKRLAGCPVCPHPAAWNSKGGRHSCPDSWATFEAAHHPRILV